MKHACVSCPLTEMWFIYLSQTRRPVIMAGTSSKDSATNTLPIGVHGTQLKGNAVSREHTWQASCLMRSRSLWTVCTVRIPLSKSGRCGFKGSEISSWWLSFYISILKYTFRMFKRHTLCSSCLFLQWMQVPYNYYIIICYIANTLFLRRRMGTVFLALEIDETSFSGGVRFFVHLTSMTKPPYIMLGRHKEIVPVCCVTQFRQHWSQPNQNFKNRD